MTIKNIIFDLGGVIYDIRYENMGEALSRLGTTDMDRFYTKGVQSAEMDSFERGEMTASEFRDYLRRLTGIDMSDSQADDVVNAVLIDVPRSRVELLQRLRSNYRLFLFSNTNQINYDCFRERLYAKFGFDIFDTCFERAYFSQLMHTRKPSAEGFYQIMADNGLIASETLFIDDIAANADGARHAGLHAHHLTEPDIAYLFDSEARLLPDIAL